VKPGTAFSFTVPGLPVSGNARLTKNKYGGFMASKEYRDYKERVRSTAKAAALVARYTMPKLVTVSITLTKTRIDLDNCAKAILDALEGVAYENDRDVTTLQIHRNQGVGATAKPQVLISVESALWEDAR
jgi:Holliday junction resolvase RusA-like endonuclease